jgi:hypothetical protein
MMRYNGPAATSFYTPFWAGIENDWYRNPEIDSVWKDDYDRLIEQLVDKHAPYIYPFAREIFEVVDRENNTSFVEKGRYIEYYVLTRAYQMPRTREKWLNAVARESSHIQTCSVCQTASPLLNYHPEMIRQYGTNPPWCRSCNYVIRRDAKFWDADTRSRVGTLLTRAKEPRDCDICGNSFTLHDRIFTYASFGTKFVDLLYPNLFANICPACFNTVFADRKMRSSKVHLKALYELSDFLGKVPTQDLENLFYLFKDKESILRLTVLLQKMRTPAGYKQEFGSFFAALVAAGVLPGGSRRTLLGTMTMSKDGHICLSLIEKEIDDFISAEGIAHNKEVHYPGSRLRADWELVGASVRTFVEYFGLLSHVPYADRVQQKRRIASETGIYLIELLPNSDWKAKLLAWKNTDGR